ncbi:hypothetical protein [Persicirhabdus sediminis]|uniref:Uncharacterized protein n=1 Tax=Persicirhabdus sediminis TaxID=454144 RepID=A0A8J7MG30_9BACT|nr:hypothetical protein [Persicirhabdus sediminis]MBK1792387.1 hypothetical protein [Persicirhabdus sediminis]
MSTWAQAEYKRPLDSPELFRVERVALTVEQMADLAGALVILSERPHEPSAYELRVNAKLFALASRLGADKSYIDSLQTHMAKGEILGSHSADIVDMAKGEVMHMMLWLADEAAGRSSNNLALGLRDVIADIDQLPIDEAFNWKGVIATLDEFSAPAKEEKSAAALDVTDIFPELADKPVEVEPVVEEKGPQLPAGKWQVKLPLEWVVGAGKDVLGVARPTRKYTARGMRQVTLSAAAVSDININTGYQKGPLLVVISPDTESRLAKKIGSRLVDWVKPRYEGLPQGKLTVMMDRAYGSSNGEAVALPMILFVESLIAGESLNENLHISANLQADDSLKKSPSLWLQLESLMEGESSGVLLVGAGSEDQLKDVLVMGHPDFFARWEVIEVNNVEEAMSRSGAVLKDENLAKARTIFEDVKRVSAGGNAARMAANVHVQTRLREILQLEPNHLSAQMLLIQGNLYQRPSKLSEGTVALKLDGQLEKLTPVLMGGVFGFSSPASQDTLDEFKKAVKELGEYVERDQELMAEFNGLIRDLDSITRLAKRARRGDYRASSDANVSLLSAKNQHKELKNRLMGVIAGGDTQAPAE